MLTMFHPCLSSDAASPTRVEHHTKKLENPKPQMTLDRAGSLGYFVDVKEIHFLPVLIGALLIGV